MKPLINTVIQQPRWRRNATNRQTRHRAPRGDNGATTTRPHAKRRSSTHARHTMQTRPPSARQSPQERRAHRVTSTQQAPTQAHKRAQKQKRRPTPTKERAGRRSHTHTPTGLVSAPNDHDTRRISSTRSRSSSVKEMSPSGQRPAARFCARRPSRYTASDSPQPRSLHGHASNP